MRGDRGGRTLRLALLAAALLEAAAIALFVYRVLSETP
jgi:hypothetical protein